MGVRARRSGRRSRGRSGLAVGTKRTAYWNAMRETVVTGTGQAVFVPGEWRSLASCLGLSPRECGIVRAVFDGNSEKDTAARLGLSPHTVHTYVWRIYRKLHVQSREELLVRVFAEFRTLPKRSNTDRKKQDAGHRAL